MNNYLKLTTEINISINDFMEYLHPKIKIPILDEAYLADPNNCWNLTESDWGQTKFPNGEKRGVYFLFGRNKNNNSILGLYIGKSSFNSQIGARLYSHLRKGDLQNKIYTWGDYILELVVTIALDKDEDRAFLSSALEEFLIDDLQRKGIKLLNTVGG